MIKETDRLLATFHNQFLTLRFNKPGYFELQTLFFCKEQPPLLKIQGFPDDLSIDFNKQGTDHTQFRIGPIQSFQLKYIQPTGRSSFLVICNGNYSNHVSCLTDTLPFGNYEMSFTDSNGHYYLLNSILISTQTSERQSSPPRHNNSGKSSGLAAEQQFKAIRTDVEQSAPHNTIETSEPLSETIIPEANKQEK